METRARFFVDRMLGKVAKYLRILGYDACYGSIETTSQVQALRKEGYIVITGNTRWRHVPGVFYCEATRWHEQCQKLVNAGLVRLEEIDPFSRCLRCNRALEDVAREEVAGRVPEFVYATAPSFSRCPVCGRVYWPGSHLDKMTENFQQIMGWNLEDAGKRRKA
ncbi:Mut7-C RNAse domain-containing protein [Desulfosoma caldarium]|uniref:Mut7-C RNAse domain-containing protein n=1 Tax=Desulfosoma caldarium TaxID=610254 RepID=A0A3N1UQC1_9BACT|nr:Mut7-C RNAse domain-containing protein [Desulfosoma caldarium]ROQ92273.1 hypothetical protein EDC27_1976 [Desulfosoma caldarium]